MIFDEFWLKVSKFYIDLLFLAVSAEPVQKKILLSSSEESSSEISSSKFFHSFDEKSFSKSIPISDRKSNKNIVYIQN